MFFYCFKKENFIRMGMWAAVVLVFAVPSFAEAQEDSKTVESLTDEERIEAKGYFEEGSRWFSKGEYRKAIDQFQKAYEIVHSGEILYNIGRCHEALGQADKAINNYEMYLRFFPTAEDAEEVQQRITALREAEESESSEEEIEDETEEESEPEQGNWYDGLGIGAQLGFGWAIIGPAHGASIPIELFAEYALTDILLIDLAFDFGAYANNYEFPNYAAERLVGIRAGIVGNFGLKESLSIIAGFDVGIKRLLFAPDHKWNWFNGYAKAGINYGFGESNWVLVSEAFCGLGLAWAKQARDIVGNSTNLESSPKFQLEFGAKVGMKYVF